MTLRTRPLPLDPSPTPHTQYFCERCAQWVGVPTIYSPTSDTHQCQWCAAAIGHPRPHRP